MAGNTIFLLVATAAVLLVVATSLPVAEGVPAIFVFGDSTADVGNNNYLPGDGKANHPFYGIDFPGHVPTGRFSNGYNGVDFLAHKLGFRKSPPPVLSITKPEEVLRGVSFASGGSGILDITGQNVSLSLNTQILYFEKTVETLNKIMGYEEAHKFLSKSLFLFLTGNNDMFGFFSKFGPQNSTQKDQFISTLAFSLKGQLQKVYELGARKFAFIGTTRIGCVPAVRVTTGTGNCAEDLNDLSLRFNKAVLALLSDMSSNLKGMKYSVANAYRVLWNVLNAPSHFGYKEVESACCGGGALNAVQRCTTNATLCPNRREFLFFDGVHPTQATYWLVAKYAFRGSSLFAAPINIKHLARS